MTNQKPPPETILNVLIDHCLQAGASDADASFGQSEGVSVDVRDGKLESIERSESQGVSLRCFFGQRQASVSGSDVSPEGLTVLAERCVAMARVVPEDPFCGLAAASEIAQELPEVDVTGDGEIASDVLEADALEAEAAALSVVGVKQVSGCGNGWSRSQRWVAASNGFSSYRESGSTGLGLAAVAERDGAMERDYESRSVRKLEDRPCVHQQFCQFLLPTAGLRACELSGSHSPVPWLHRVPRRRQGQARSIHFPDSWKIRCSRPPTAAIGSSHCHSRKPA